MSREMVIGKHVISDDSPAYVIAEIGHNHQGSLDTAKELFKQATACGVSAVKLQKRDNFALYTKALYDKPYDNENSFGATYGEHREFLEFNEDQYVELQGVAAELAVDFFATAFDFPSADLLEGIGVPAFKMASGDLRNTPLLTYVAKFGKPMVISTGGGTIDDVKRAHDAIMPINQQLCIMQCTAGSPAEFAELDLRVIATYREMFPDVVVGYSGHDNGIAMPVAAYVLGARVIEKHFTLNRAMKGTDHKFSLEPVGMRKMVRDLTRVRVALGDGRKKVYPTERDPITKMSKKIVAARDLSVGHVLVEDDFALKSPGDGVPPYEMYAMIGQALKVHVRAEDAIRPDMLAAPGSLPHRAHGDHR
jgi:N-acetylneuraminate synthase/sialic acid synthase